MIQKMTLSVTNTNNSLKIVPLEMEGTLDGGKNVRLKSVKRSNFNNATHLCFEKAPSSRITGVFGLNPHKSNGGKYPFTSLSDRSVESYPALKELNLQPEETTTIKLNLTSTIKEQYRTFYVYSIEPDATPPIKSKVSVDIRTIGPEEALRLLSTNSSNRSISSNNVARYTKDILEGRWPLNGETITLDPDGNLLDGQHRLTAVVNANRAVDFIVITGISPEARSTMDTGKSRNGKDIVKMIGNVDQEGLIASAIRKIDLYNRGKLNSTSGNNPTPNHETERLFKIHGEGLQESLDVVKRLGRGTTGKTLLRNSLALFLFYNPPAVGVT